MKKDTRVLHSFERYEGDEVDWPYGYTRSLYIEPIEEFGLQLPRRKGLRIWWIGKEDPVK